MKKCTFYDELQELLRCRPINIQEGMDSLNATSSNFIDVNMFDNIPDPDGASPGCSKFSDEDLHTNKNKYYFQNIDTSSNSISENDNFDNIEESSDLTSDKEVNSISGNDNFDNIEESSDLTSDKEVKQLETSINNVIIDNDDNDLTNNEIIDNAMLETNKNKDLKKKCKINKSSNICSSI